MKVIFNTDNYPTQALKETAYTSYQDAIFSDTLKFVCLFDDIEVLRNTNKESGKPLLLLSHSKEILDVRIIEFDTLIEMFHFIDSISIFKID